MDGSTTAGAITLNGTYTSDLNSSTYLYGTINNNSNLLANGGANTNTYLYVPGTVTLTGGGTVSLNTAIGNGNANLEMLGGAILDNVNNTIQGEGIIWNDGATLINEAGGIINANSTGSPLVNDLAVEYGTVNNKGLMEATNNGVLTLYDTTVNNTGGGSIVANGPGASVQLPYATIQGGTLNNNGGAFFGTPNGYWAVLDGSTGAGQITLKGTYTSDFNSSTYLYGTINNTGNLLVNGGANTNTYLYVPSSVSLTGGGTVSLNTAGGGGSAYIQLTGGATLDNVNNTIQGQGIIYNNGATIINEAGGTIVANSPGGVLEIEYGTLSNAGTLKATDGGTLFAYDGSLSNFNSSTDTLTGGTYVVNGTSGASTLQIDALGTTGGEIQTNDATITLIGTNANVYFLDAASLNALSDLSVNNGELDLEGGYTFTAPSTFTNSGNVLVGAGSTLSASSTYTQTGGETQVDGSLAAPSVNINGGTLAGAGGTITGNVTNGGTVQPGDNLNTPVDPPGDLTILGNYTQLAFAQFIEDIAGMLPADASQLNVHGNVALDANSLLTVNLLNGFDPMVTERFLFLTYTGTLGGDFFLTDPAADHGTFSVEYDPGQVFLDFTASTTSAVPEPSAIVLFGTMALALFVYGRRRLTA